MSQLLKVSTASYGVLTCLLPLRLFPLRSLSGSQAVFSNRKKSHNESNKNWDINSHYKFLQ